MKKIVISLLIVLLALAVLIGTLVFLFTRLSALGGHETEAPSQDAANYIAEQWPGYQFVSFSGGVLTLDYPLNATFEQIQKHGLDAGFDELASGHLDTAVLIAAGVERSCGKSVTEVLVIGRSSDGREAYRASTTQGVTGCWADE